MKKLTDVLRFAVFVTAVALCLASCSDNKQDTAGPSVVFDYRTVEVTMRGGEFHIGYECFNVSPAALSAESDGDWVSRITVSDEELSFSAAPNTENKERTTTVYMKHDNTELGSFTVRQEPLSEGFIISIDDVSPLSVSYSVFSADKDMTYLTLLMFKSDMDAYYNTDEKLHESDLQYIQQNPESSDIFLRRGNASGIKYDNLLPATDFVIYAYGVDSDMNQITGIEKLVFTTDENENMTDMDFEIEVSDKPAENTKVTMSVVPSDNDSYYYYDIISVASLEKKCMPLREHCNREVMEQILFGEVIGMPLKAVLKALCSKGPDKLDIPIRENGKHIAYAYSVGDDGLINSEITTIECNFEL